GGGGINVARNLRRMGMDVLAIFPAGGSHGQQLRHLLEEAGLPCLPVSIQAETTRNLALTEEDTGRQFHLVFPGATLEEAEWETCLSTVDRQTPSGSHLVISGSLPGGIPADYLARIIQTVKPRDVKVILDTSGPALRPALDAGVHLAKLNREEFAELGYSGDGDIASRLSLMGELVEAGMAERLIVTLGPGGALLATREGLRLHARPPQVDVVSHVGAGDSFVSVMTCRLQQGEPVDVAFRYGVAAAAAAISTPGNQLRDLDWLEQLYQGTRDD
ncbi:MAG: 1-phosphofructokinase family hexose kinase, partial [Pseudomonadota bacterium]